MGATSRRNALPVRRVDSLGAGEFRPGKTVAPVHSPGGRLGQFYPSLRGRPASERGPCQGTNTARCLPARGLFRNFLVLLPLNFNVYMKIMNATSSLSPIILSSKVEQTMDAIRNARDVVITTHISPDGDALGASLALYHFLKSQGKNARVIVPYSFPYFLRWMEGAGEIEIYEYNPAAGQRILASADLIFSLDYNILKRVGQMGPHL